MVISHGGIKNKASEYRSVLDFCDRSKLNGIRDYALLKLLWDNALRRNEVSLLNYGDFDPLSRELKILGERPRRFTAGLPHRW